MCATAAPARAASTAASAIWSGVTGTLSERETVSPAPVTAQVMKTSRFVRERHLPASLSWHFLSTDLDADRRAHHLTSGEAPLCRERTAMLFAPSRIR